MCGQRQRWVWVRWVARGRGEVGGQRQRWGEVGGQRQRRGGAKAGWGEVGDQRQRWVTRG